MATTETSFPEADATRALNIGVPEDFPVDPISSDVATSKARSEAKAKARAKAEAANCDLGNTLMSVLLISGVVVAAVGVAFIITKKLKET